MKKHFNLKDCDSEDMYGVHEEEALLALAEGREEEMFERIIEKYLAYSADKEFVMISSFTSGDDSLHWAGKLCSALNIPSILIGDSSHDTQFGVTRAAFEGHGALCLGASKSLLYNQHTDVMIVSNMFVLQSCIPSTFSPMVLRSILLELKKKETCFWTAA